MSNLARPLDPEFQAVYDEVNAKSAPKAHDAEVLQKDRQPSGATGAPPGDVVPEDGFEAFKRLAEQQHKENSHLPKAPMGSFDHFEQGVSATVRLGWDWLTR